jgi:mono/diheme cytochrome c family protein
MHTILSGGRLTAVLVVLVASAGLAYGGADEGKALYEKQCKVCHSVKGDAGKMGDKGGPLDGVGAKRDAKWLKAYLADPKSQMPDAKMPKMKLSDQQLDDLVAFLLTLK